jgi:hypothetical protein
LFALSDKVSADRTAQIPEAGSALISSGKQFVYIAQNLELLSPVKTLSFVQVYSFLNGC